MSMKTNLILFALGLTALLGVAGCSQLAEPSVHAAPSTSQQAPAIAPPAPSERNVAHQAVTQRAVIHANESSFEKEVLQSTVPVLVDFYADWCGPCKALAAVLEQVAKEVPNAKVVKVNVDDSPKLAARYEIEGIPAILVFKDGKLADQTEGLASKAELVRLLRR